ncbi:MAG: hypothetical protein P4L22_06330 [Candidatus Babeliales bacterium]|nr:hypothetical protein [Candidatus Babeliales bacterium]
MKLFIFILFMVNNLYTHAADSTSSTSTSSYVTSENVEYLKNNLQRIRIAKEHKNDYYFGCHGTKDCFPGKEMTWENDILSWYNNIRKKLKLSTAEKISKQQFDSKFLNILKKQLEAFEGIKEEKPSSRCSIAGLDKKDVIKVLFDAAQNKFIDITIHMNIVQSATPSNERRFFDINSMRSDFLFDEEIQNILNKKGDIDYLKGREMKINVSGDVIYTMCFNRANGYNAAENAIEKLRNSTLIWLAKYFKPEHLVQIQKLLENCADTMIKDEHGKTFHDYAKDNPEIQDLLENMRLQIEKKIDDVTFYPPEIAGIISEYLAQEIRYPEVAEDEE